MGMPSLFRRRAQRPARPFCRQAIELLFAQGPSGALTAHPLILLQDRSDRIPSASKMRAAGEGGRCFGRGRTGRFARYAFAWKGFHIRTAGQDAIGCRIIEEEQT